MNCIHTSIIILYLVNYTDAQHRRARSPATEVEDALPGAATCSCSTQGPQLRIRWQAASSTTLVRMPVAGCDSQCPPFPKQGRLSPAHNAEWWVQEENDVTIVSKSLVLGQFVTQQEINQLITGWKNDSRYLLTMSWSIWDKFSKSNCYSSPKLFRYSFTNIRQWSVFAELNEKSQGHVDLNRQHSEI